MFTGAVEELRARGSDVIDKRLSETGSAAAAALRMIWRCRADLRRVDAVMIEFGSNDLAVFWFGFLAVTLRRDVVLVAHDPPMIAHAPGAGLIPRDSTWRLRVAYRILSPTLDRWLIAHVIGRAGAIVVLGAQARDALQRSTARPVLVAPHGLGALELPKTLPSAGEYVLFAGFLAPAKGLDILIRAWSSLGDIRLRLVIAGGASADHESWVEELRKESALIHNAPEWLGQVQDDVEFDALFREAAIVVLPYRTSSPASGILVRAMATGRCVVATRVQACAEVLEDDVSGVLVDVEDQAALSRTIERLANQPHERDRLGRSALERAAEVFGWEKYSSALEEAFSLARRGSQSTTGSRA